MPSCSIDRSVAFIQLTKCQPQQLDPAGIQSGTGQIQPLFTEAVPLNPTYSTNQLIAAKQLDLMQNGPTGKRILNTLDLDIEI
jgi:hypothetical protein